MEGFEPVWRRGQGPQNSQAFEGSGFLGNFIFPFQGAHFLDISISFSDLKFPSSNCPRDPITLSDDDWGVQSPPQQGI